VNRLFRDAFLALLVVALAGCAGVPKTALRPEVKQSIKRIALIEVPEPPEYRVYPGQAPSTGALMMFGAIGGAIAGGIEESRTKEATTRFTMVAVPLKPDLTGILYAELEKGLAAKGYTTLRVPPPPKKPDGSPDYRSIAGQFDAILAMTFNCGYHHDSRVVAPRIIVFAELLSKDGMDRLFSDNYLYSSSSVGFGEIIRIDPDPKYTFKSVDALYGDATIPVEGMRTGTLKLVERLLADL
jgi:hypothetical protein